MVKSETMIREEKRKEGVLARDLASALKVSDEDIRKRREERRRRKMKEREMVEFEEDPIWNLTEGDAAVDPNIWGFPFIWVQVGHVLLGSVLVAAALLGGNDVEFALFDFQGEALAALRASVLVAVTINFVNAIVTYFEEKSAEGSNADALGWALKGLFLGGVSSWQRLGRIYKVEKKARDEEIDQVIDALQSQPDGTPDIVERIDDQGRILPPAELKKQRLLATKEKQMLLEEKKKEKDKLLKE